MANRLTFPFRMVTGALVTLLICFLLGGAAWAAEEVPVTAKVGFELQSIRKVNVLTGDFEADFHLSFACSAKCQPGGFLLENGRIVNAVPVVDSPAQKVYLVRAQLSADIDTRKFPFDQQALTITLRAPDDSIHYELDPAATPTNLNVDAAEWRPGNQIQILPGAGLKDGAPSVFRYTFGLTINRPLLESILRYMLPALALMFSAMLVLFLDPDDFKTKLGMALSSFIGQIFLQISIGGRIPVREYLTYWDKYLIISYLTVSLIILYVWWDNALKIRERKEIRGRLISVSKVLFPVGWGALQVLTAISTFR
ncbi:MAG TPA: hypothetical protein VD902_10045 [Symbiobacteriaceae bacterium]|nr:hypothetical protein [Symbiobacteriaceae bacterium]